MINYEFISGNYSSWSAKNETADGKRIVRLHNDDPDKKVIDDRTGRVLQCKILTFSIILNCEGWMEDEG